MSNPLHIRLLLLLACFCSSVAIVSAQNIAEGYYIGMIEMCSIDSSGTKECYTDPADPRRKWYHLTKIKLSGDSIFVDQSPVGVRKRDTVYSASDGGFYYYRGTISKKQGGWRIHLKMVSCDYCTLRYRRLPNGDREVISNSKEWIATFHDQQLEINGNYFRRSDKIQLRSEANK